MLTTIIECVDLEAELAFFRDRVGCHVYLVSPADDPRRVVLTAPGGGALELVRSADERPVVVAFDTERSEDQELMSPGGSAVTLRSACDSGAPLGAGMAVPASAATLAVVDASDGAFGVGRAGMEYRDLLPDRWGGRFIASHIKIAEGGDVADWVHFHRIRFQMIYVAAGWVDVVYEDQGPPFRMFAGDCVLQPPEIRHRVLRSSAGLEVIEIGCPAEHDTVADHDRDLPTGRVDVDRTFWGQRFVRHVAADAEPKPWVASDMVVRDTGIGAATNGLAGVVVVSAASDPAAGDSGATRSGMGSPTLTHRGEFVLVVGLSGTASLDVEGRGAVALEPRSSIALPAGACWKWASRSDDHSALVVTLPADAVDIV